MIVYPKEYLEKVGLLAKKYNVASIPTIVIEVDGKEAKRFVGFTDAKTIEGVLNSL